MKILNKTYYETNSLRKLFTRCLKEQSKIEGELLDWQKKKLTVHIGYSRAKDNRSYVSGKAIVNGKTIWMFIPKDITRDLAAFAFVPANTKPLVRDIAYVFLHELGHIRGFMHRKMYRQTFIEMANSFAHEFSIKIKAPIVKQKEDVQVKRYHHVLKVLTEKQTIFKRLQKQIQKYTVKKKYYEKVLVQAGKL